MSGCLYFTIFYKKTRLENYKVLLIGYFCQKRRTLKQLYYFNSKKLRLIITFSQYFLRIIYKCLILIQDL